MMKKKILYVFILVSLVLGVAAAGSIANINKEITVEKDVLEQLQKKEITSYKVEDTSDGSGIIRCIRFNKSLQSAIMDSCKEFKGLDVKADNSKVLDEWEKNEMIRIAGLIKAGHNSSLEPNAQTVLSSGTTTVK